MRRFVSFSVSALLAVSLVLPYFTLPCYAYADDQEDASRAPDAVEPPPAVSSIPLSDVLGGADGYSGGGIETGGAAAPDAGTSGGAGRAPEEGGSGLEEARSPGEAEEEAVEAPPEVGSLDLLPALVRSVGSNVQSPLVWVANVISQYIAYNPSNSERYYTHFTLASIYSALYGYQTINGSHQLVSYYSGGIGGMLASSNNYLYSILGGQLDIYNRLDSIRYVVDSGMLSLDERLRDNLSTGLAMDGVTDGRYGVATVSALTYNKARQIAISTSNLVSSLAMSTVTPGSYGVATISALVYNKLFNVNAQLVNLVTSVSIGGYPDASRSVATVSAIIANQLRTSLPMDGVTEGYQSVATILALTYNKVRAIGISAANLVTSLPMSGVTEGSYGVGTVLALIYNKAYNANAQLANLVTSASISGYPDASRSVATVSAIIANQLRTSLPMDGVTEGPHSVATVLALIYNKLARINSAMGSLSVDVDFPALDALYAKLDGIMDLMRLGLAVDVADAILGDLDFSGLSALAADVSGALSSAFPFCVPALLKQVLGLVQADPSPPSFHFEIMGAPLDFDFSGYQGFADVTGWVCRLTLVLVLLAASPRFVVGSKVGGA